MIDIKEVAKNMTREEFLNYVIEKEECCPSSSNLKEFSDERCHPYSGCLECWKEAVKDIKFKNDMEAEKVSKQLNIIEAMKMPIGTEFKVIFNGEEIKNNTMIIYRSLVCEEAYKHMDWKCRPQDTFMKPYDFLINGVFIPIQQPVSFMEAVVSEKRVKAECEGYSSIDEKYYRVVEVFKDIIMANKQFGNEIVDKAIKNFITKGKWYIEESEADSDDIR